MNSTYAQERAGAALPVDLPICRYNPRAEGLERFLGPLESAVMEIFWTEVFPLEVKTVWRKARESYRDSIALTSVLSTITRLHRKGFFSRRKNVYAYVYIARETREEFEERQIAAILESIERAA